MHRHHEIFESLWEGKLKKGGLVYLEKESSRQPSTQTVTWVLPTAFSQIYCGNQGQGGIDRKI